MKIVNHNQLIINKLEVKTSKCSLFVVKNLQEGLFNWVYLFF